MSKFQYLVTVETGTQEEADTVIRELMSGPTRINFDEEIYTEGGDDEPIEYTIDYETILDD